VSSDGAGDIARDNGGVDKPIAIEGLQIMSMDCSGASRVVSEISK